MRRLSILATLSLFTVLMLSSAAVAQSNQADRNCADFATQEAAQANLVAYPNDPNGLDADNDGVACGQGVNVGQNDGVGDGVVTGDDLNCIDITQAEAQAVYDADSSDPNNLDADNDGVACETIQQTTNSTQFEDDSSVTSSAGTVDTDDSAVSSDQYSGDDATGDDIAALPDTGGPALLPVAALIMSFGVLSFAALHRKQ